MIDFDRYQHGVIRTANPALGLMESKMSAALGLGEAGEVQNIIKKELFHGHPEDRMAVMDELGDVLYYVAWTAYLYNIDLSLVAQMNHDKLKARYPDGFSTERSINREHGFGTMPSGTHVSHG